MSNTAPGGRGRQGRRQPASGRGALAGGIAQRAPAPEIPLPRSQAAKTPKPRTSHAAKNSPELTEAGTGGEQRQRPWNATGLARRRESQCLRSRAWKCTPRGSGREATRKSHIDRPHKAGGIHKSTPDQQSVRDILGTEPAGSTWNQNQQ